MRGIVTLGALMAVGLVGCSAASPPADWMASRVLIHASNTEFGSAGYACDDTVEVARLAGVDYNAVVEGCLQRNPRDLHTLFWLTANAGFDAASSQGHAAVLGFLLRHVGDGFFGPLLAREDPAVRTAVLNGLYYDFGEDATERLMAAWYPVTFGPPAVQETANDRGRDDAP